MTRSRTRPPIWLAALSLIAGACTVGPDYEPPDFTVETVPDQWRTTVETEMAADTTDLEMWWTSFNDSLLTELIKRSEFGNLDLQAAVGRVAEARAIRGVAKGGYWPDIVLGGAYSYQKLSENGLQGAQAGQPGDDGGSSLLSDPFDSWTAGLSLSWEIDLFGRIRRTVEAADAQLQASVEDYRDVLVTLYAEVGSAYVDARAFQTRLDFATQNGVPDAPRLRDPERHGPGEQLRADARPVQRRTHIGPRRSAGRAEPGADQVDDTGPGDRARGVAQPAGRAARRGAGQPARRAAGARRPASA